MCTGINIILNKYHRNEIKREIICEHKFFNLFRTIYVKGFFFSFPSSFPLFFVCDLLFLFLYFSEEGKYTRVKFHR